SATTITVLRAIRHRAALRCGGGAGLVVVGLTLLAVATCAGASERLLPLAAAPVIVGPLVAWSGARRITPTPTTPPPSDGGFAGLPVLAMPLGASLVAIAFRLVAGETLDQVGLLLGAGMVTVLAVRETAAAVDVRRYARRMAEQEARMRALVAGASDVTVVLGDDLVVRWQSPAGPRRFNLPDHEVVGRRFTDLLHPDDAAVVADRLRAITAGRPGREVGAHPRFWRRGSWVTAVAGERSTVPPFLEARILDGFGRYRETESTVSDLRALPEVGALVLNIRDVGERCRLERAVARLTSTDQLTGLPNRREVVRAVAGRRRGGRR